MRFSYNRYPDEKGTERIYCRVICLRRIIVTTATPMKRGLKVILKAVGIC